jgi:hypothetical protein
MDQKSSRVFVRSVVVHLKKSMKSFDETHPETIVATIEDHLKMIKMAYNLPMNPKKKKGKKKTKKKSAPEEPAPVAVVVDTESK